MRPTKTAPPKKSKPTHKPKSIVNPRRGHAQITLDTVGIDTICEKVADCTTLREIAEEYKISKGALIEWLADYGDQYARAREAQADVLASDILALSDKTRIGTKTTTKANGDVETTTGDMVDRARLQIDARKWLAGKMSPKKYGDKVAVGGADDLPPVKHAVDVILSPSEAYLRMIGK